MNEEYDYMCIHDDIDAQMRLMLYESGREGRRSLEPKLIVLSRDASANFKRTMTWREKLNHPDTGPRCLGASLHLDPAATEPWRILTGPEADSFLQAEAARGRANRKLRQKLGAFLRDTA